MIYQDVPKHVNFEVRKTSDTFLFSGRTEVIWTEMKWYTVYVTGMDVLCNIPHILYLWQMPVSVSAQSENVFKADWKQPIRIVCI